MTSGTDPCTCTQNEVMQVEEKKLLCNGQRRLRCREELTDDKDGDVPDEMSSDEEDDQCEHELMDVDDLTDSH